MKQTLLIMLAAIAGTVSAAAALTLPQGSTAIHIEAQASTGLNGGIYVFEQAAGVRLSSSFRAGTSVSWQRFGSMGAAYAEAVTPVSQTATTSVIELGQDDAGYILTEGNTVTYFWVVNYARHQLQLDGIAFADEQECDRTMLALQGNGDRILYYTINGRGDELSRQLQIEYSTLVYNADSETYQPETVTVEAPYVHTVSVAAPLCDTQFHISGDRFLRQWGREQTAVSPLWQARAVAAETSAEQLQRDVPNEQTDAAASNLGGSAPCEITFKAAVSDAAVYREWQISSDPEFGLVDLTYNDLEFTYTFREQGTQYVRFIANNAAGDCEYVGTTYDVFVGESALKCPNAFSPQTSPGVNDEWRVSYKSLISFECHIFNKWGTELFSTTDPATGWDGRYGGKYVPAGVYYYVINATGSDGRKYKLAGDINIIGYNERNNTVTEE